MARSGGEYSPCIPVGLRRWRLRGTRDWVRQPERRGGRLRSDGTHPDRPAFIKRRRAFCPLQFRELKLTAADLLIPGRQTLTTRRSRYKAQTTLPRRFVFPFSFQFCSLNGTFSSKKLAEGRILGGLRPSFSYVTGLGGDRPRASPTCIGAQRRPVSPTVFRVSHHDWIGLSLREPLRLRPCCRYRRYSFVNGVRNGRYPPSFRL